jgi:hypothetical protein
MTRIPPRPIPPRLPPVLSDVAIVRLPLVAFTEIGTRYAATPCAPLDESFPLPRGVLVQQRRERCQTSTWVLVAETDVAG